MKGIIAILVIVVIAAVLVWRNLPARGRSAGKTSKEDRPKTGLE